MISTAPAVKSEDLILTVPAGEESGDSIQAPMPASNGGATMPADEESSLDPVFVEGEDGPGVGDAHPPSPSNSAALAADLQGLTINEQR